MPGIDREQQQIEEARKQFNEAKNRLILSFRELNKIDAATPHTDVVRVLREMAQNFSESYRTAEITPETADNLWVRQKEAQVQVKLQTLPVSLKEYFVAYLTFLRIKGMSPASGLQKKLLEDVKDNMEAAVLTAGWPELQAEFSAIEPELDDLQERAKNAKSHDKETLEGNDPKNKPVALRNLANTLVDWDLLSSKDDNLGTPIDAIESIPNLKSVVLRSAQRIDAGTTLEEDQERILDDALDRLKKDARIFKVQQTVAEQIRNLRSVVYRILHENRAIIIDRDARLRGFLRPSTKDIPEEVYGEMMMFLGEVGGLNIDEAEALGLAIALSDQPEKAVDKGDLDKLKKLRDRINEIKKRYISLRTSVQPIAESGNLSYLANLIREIDRYVSWLNKLVDTVDKPVAPVVTISGEYNLTNPDKAEAAKEWTRFIDDNDTVNGLDNIARLLVSRVYNRDDVVPSYDLGDRDDRIESAVYQYWRNKVAALRGPESHTHPDHKKEYQFLLNKYEHLFRLKDADLIQANTASLTSDVLANLDTYEKDKRLHRMSEEEYFYFLNEAENIQSEYDHYEHASKVKWSLNKIEELLTEKLDPNDLYDPKDPNPFSKGRFWGFNFNESTDDAKIDLRKRLHKEVADKFGLTDTEDADGAIIAEIVDIAICIAGVSAIRFDTYAEVLLQGISPRGLLANRLNNINEFFPLAGAAYSTYAGEKYLEISLATEVDHALEESWDYTKDLERFPGLSDARKRLHMIEESYRGTRLAREQFAPLRKRWKVSYLEGHRVLKAPMPTIYQCFVAKSKLAESRTYSLAGWVDAVKGYMDFQEKVLEEIKVKEGESPAHARQELVHKLESALDTFSKIKNVDVDWGYFAHMVLHLVDKLYFAYAEIDQTVEGSEQLYEMIIEKFGLLVGSLRLKKTLAAFPKKPTPDTYLKLAPTNTFWEDGVEWTIGDYLITQLQAQGVYWEYMKDKVRIKGEKLPSPPEIHWIRKSDEVLRRQPWGTRTTPKALMAKASYLRFKGAHATFDHTVRLYGTGKKNATKEATALDKK